MSINSQTYKVYTLLNAPKIHADLIWDMAYLFVGLSALYFISVFYFRNKISANSGRVKQRKAELATMISEFLFHEDNASKLEKTNYVVLKIEIRELMKDDFNRKVLSEILMDLRKDVSGEAQMRLFKLYTDLGLQNDAFEKLKSWRWQVISKGILELTQMQVQESYSFITKFLNDKRSVIRKQAEIATVTLKHEGISYFLDTTNCKISEWQQLKLLDVLRNQKDFQPPSFKAWLTFRNKHVVLFALRLMRYYRQNDVKDSLIELIKHTNNQIKEEAIKCIKEFNIMEALDTLQTVFWKSSEDIKISILDAMALIGNEKQLPFLQSIEKKESNFSVKNKALSTINTICPESVMPTENIVQIGKYEAPGDLVNMDDLVEVDNFTSEQNRNEDLFMDSIEDSIDMALKENPETNEAGKIDESFELELGESESTATINQNGQFSFDFIPMVIEDFEEIEHQSKINKSQSDLDQETTASEYKTALEATPFSDIKTSEEQELQSFDITNIDFLPIVKANKNEETFDTLAQNPDNENILREAKNMEVHYEEIVMEKDELDFLPIVTEMENDNEIEFHNLKDFEKPMGSFDQIDNDDLHATAYNYEKHERAISENILTKEDIDEEFLVQLKLDVEQSQEEDVVSWLLTQNAIREIELCFETVEGWAAIYDLIPKPIYYNEREANVMAFLNDLEELGDHREIPLLEEYRAQEEISFIKERIDNLIAAFSTNKDTMKTNESTSVLNKKEPVFSVFEDLFRFCDTEKKLILMDEIVAVGDEKELRFLDGLLEDPNYLIREKAHTVLEGLFRKLAREQDLSITSTKLDEGQSQDVLKSILTYDKYGLESMEYDFLIEEMEIRNAETQDFLDIEFELSKEFAPNNFDSDEEALTGKQADNTSFFDRLLNMPSKIIDQLNG